jgi:hypothetical protein
MRLPLQLHPFLVMELREKGVTEWFGMNLRQPNGIG